MLKHILSRLPLWSLHNSSSYQAYQTKLWGRWKSWIIIIMTMIRPKWWQTSVQIESRQMNTDGQIPNNFLWFCFAPNPLSAVGKWKKLVLRMHVAATAIRYWDNCTCCQRTTLFPDIEDSSCYFHYCKVSWLTSGLGVVWPRWPRLPRQDRSVRRLQTRCSQPELQRIVPWVSPRRKVNLTKNSGLLKIFNFYFKFQPRA